MVDIDPASRGRGMRYLKGSVAHSFIVRLKMGNFSRSFFVVVFAFIVLRAKHLVTSSSQGGK